MCSTLRCASNEVCGARRRAARVVRALRIVTRALCAGGVLIAGRDERSPEGFVVEHDAVALGELSAASAGQKSPLCVHIARRLGPGVRDPSVDCSAARGVWGRHE